ncbi:MULTISPECIES: Rieske 2Fe-2S domain-containing protein [unclassified Beijerinckia]|uniref:Rieske (2Fe-2S) protein n=1 Tax=unclassified Beijerinckia TaxID=2638183 RepID=UPI000894AA81|nr:MULTISPECIES: Rieske 2Fe-2S domain-containing protein [unclassified Beijerinckia]MDH7799042.1 3-phenylpropionate/trans-cinnamate dioxygenase ferredoxin subunit [Beijerinckia sp. GAS462]SED96936.1 3-phenylpropionate/trans-cinnamate dioxygenase ferredoxin subunit/p-cumate 2,3-dioxygenase ferredoxin subunit [Beijerinckia sp. 28-YEA-48]
MSDTTLAPVRLCPISQVSDNEILKIAIDGHDALAVVKSGDTYFVCDDLCPHAAASLAEGYLEEGRIVCPVHYAEFDLGSGEAHHAPPGCGTLRFYNTAIIDGDLFAYLS